MKKDQFLVTILIVASLLITYYCQQEGIFNKYMIHDDATQYLPAAYALQPGPLHKALLDDDLIVKYMVLKDSPGHLYLYYLWGLLFDPLLLIKLLPFLLCALTTVCFFYFGKAIKNSTTGFFAALIFSFYLWTSKFGFLSGGLPKAFIFPLFLLFLVFLVNKKHLGCFFILILQVLFYPGIAIISLLVYFLDLCDKRRPTIKEVFKFILVLTSCFILTQLIYRRPDVFLGDLISYREMIKMPEFYMGGRDYLFCGSLKDFLYSEDASGISVSTIFPYLMLLFLISAFYLRKIFSYVPRVLFYILFSGLSVFLAAWLFLFYLFFPGRYLEYTLPIFLISVIALAIEKLSAQLKSTLPERFVLGTIFITIVLFFIPFLQKNLTDYQRPYFEFLKTLPEETLLAGHPFEMDPILTFAKRRVLVQFEVSTAWYKNYYEKIKERTNDFFKAYYSASLPELEYFFRKYGINYLIVYKGHFKEGYLSQGDFYLKPFNGEIKNIVSKNYGKFVLNSETIHDYKIYEDNDFFVISNINCLKPAEARSP